jgi:micrococcal nuclease
MPRTLLPLLLSLLLAAPAAASDPGRARFVPDGDTLVLESGAVVRLAGIDAPETAFGRGRAQRFADESRRALRELVRGQDLAVQPVGRGRDRYGRVLALVRLADGTELNAAMLRRGLAFFYWFDDLPGKLRRRLLVIQKEAMDEGRGFWPAILDLPAAQEAWIGSRRSHRACPESFPEAGRVSQPGRVKKRNLEAVFRAGMAPARDCTPWPEE